MNNMDNIELNEPFNPENIVIRREKKYKNVLKRICSCLCCLIIIIFMNYISFCIGFIYHDNIKDGSL